NGDTIHIAPIVNRDKLNYTLDIRGTRISVRIDATRKHRSDENSEYYLDGYISSPFILLPQDKKDHEIRILL
ncbi:MAG: hypothetical protein IIY51_01910, partial [Erysipelotrichaceae bacterium]|nr:hypothetical protein [Erysipelotrichaceae bacterium]